MRVILPCLALICLLSISASAAIQLDHFWSPAPCDTLTATWSSGGTKVVVATECWDMASGMRLHVRRIQERLKKYPVRP